MNDMTIKTKSATGTRWILKGLEQLMKWARLQFKPNKSRSLVLRRATKEVKKTLEFDKITSEVRQVNEE
jgi:hypothetical protein